MDLSGRVNVWECKTTSPSELTVAVHVDDGVTPFSLACRARGVDECGGTAYSWGYPDEVPIPEVVLRQLRWEWYLPKGEELAQIALHDSELLEHVRRGGLLIRPLTNAGRFALAKRYGNEILEKIPNVEENKAEQVRSEDESGGDGNAPESPDEESEKDAAEGQK
jgi:hypothetical protein